MPRSTRRSPFTPVIRFMRVISCHLLAALHSWRADREQISFCVVDTNRECAWLRFNSQFNRTGQKHTEREKEKIVLWITVLPYIKLE
jgi:hypothetical protein